MRALVYDVLYRWGAPWEAGPRAELVDLVQSGRLSPGTLPPGRAVDLGCGTGANAIFLGQHGFGVVGIDFSGVALRKAERRAAAAGLGDRLRFVRADLTAPALAGGPFDLLVDYGTLDDLTGDDRRRMAANIIRLARPGAVFLLWAFYAPRRMLPWISFRGPSRLTPTLEPGEEAELFGDAFRIERLGTPEPGAPYACFLMTRRPPVQADTPGAID